MINSLNNSLDHQNIFGENISDTLLNPSLEDENTTLGIVSSDGAFSDPFDSESESLSLIEQLIISERENENTTVTSNSSFDISLAVDSFTGGSLDLPQSAIPQESVADTSFAPPISTLEFQGGFGDFDGGDDVTLEIEDSEGNVVETYALSGEGQGTLYTDEDYAYLFFSGTDETTNVDISSQSNIKFGDFVGASLEISTPGSIDGGDVFLNDQDETEETALVLQSGLAGGASPNYEVVDYNLVDFGDVEMVDVNYYGNVVGNLIDNDGQEKIFFYNGVNLFTLGGYYSSRAFAINDFAQIVGEKLESSDSERYRPFVIFSNGATIDFTSQPGRTIVGSNSPDAEVLYYEAVGSVRDVNRYLETAYYQLNIPPVSGYPSFTEASFISPSADRSQSVNIGYTLLNSTDSRAFGINDLGQVVGVDKEINKGFVFSKSSNSVTRLGTLPGGDFSTAYEINNQGQVVGVSGSSEGSRAFLYEDGVMIDIGVNYIADPDKRSGIDINNSGQIVVTSSDGTPYLYEEGELIDINSLLNPESLPEGLQLNKVQGINDRGQIIAQGTVAGEEHGYLLNPNLSLVEDDYINIGNVSTFGDSVILQSGNIELSGDRIRTRGGNIAFDGKTVVNSNSETFVINSSVASEESEGGNVVFSGNIDNSDQSSQNLTLRTGAGNVLFQQAIGSSNPFTNFRIASAKNVVADEDIISNELIRINATEDITAQNITSNNGRVKLTSEQKSITTQDITSGGEEGDNIILEAMTGIMTANLNADELGRVKISSGKVNDDNSVVVGDVETGSITGRSLNVTNTGSFTATGDITAHDGKVEVTTLSDISTKKIESLNKSVSLVSSQGGVTIDGDLFSADKGISIIAANDISTKKVESFDGVVGLSSYQGNVAVQDDITTVNGGVVVSAKENISFVNITTEVGEVNIGSASGNIVASGDISTETGYVDIKTNGNIALQNVTTNKGYIEIGAYGKVITQNLSTNSGVITVASASNDIAVNGDINTNGSYVDLEAGLEVATNNIETNGGGVDLISFSDNADTGILIASESEGVDLSSAEVTNYEDLSDTQREIIQDFVENVWHKSRPLGDFVMGSIAQWLLLQGEDVNAVLEFSFPTFLTGFSDDTEAFLDSQSEAFQLGRDLGNGIAIVTAILEFAAGTTSQAGGGALCFFTGIGCLAGAPAIATGFLLQAHSLGVIGNATDELSESLGEELRNLLSPNRMESRGGADDIPGLAREIGVSQSKIENGIEVLGKDKIKQLRDNLVDDNQNLLRPLLDKSQEIIKNVWETLNIVGNDVDAISDIRETLRRNKVRQDGTQLIDDNQLNTAFSNSLNFLEQYGNRVSGAFPYTFGRASTETTGTLDYAQALGEIRTAEDILEGRALLKNDGSGQSFLNTIDNVSALSDLRRGVKNPDFLITDTNGATRLVEVKTPNAKMTKPRMNTSLKKALEQIIDRANLANPTDKAIIRLDYTNTAPADLQSSIIEQTVRNRLSLGVNQTSTMGTDLVEFVEVIYKDANQNNEIKKLVIQINN